MKARSRLRITGGLLLGVACGREATVSQAGFSKPVEMSSDRTVIHGGDSVTFTVKIRSDIARRVAADAPHDSADVYSHIVGWFWVPDIGAQDPWTHACPRASLACQAEIHGDGTMVFSVRIANEICADWVHIDVLSLPDVTGDDPKAREHDDSVYMAIRTKAPTWQRCSA